MYYIFNYYKLSYEDIFMNQHTIMNPLQEIQLLTTINKNHQSPIIF